MRQLHAQPSSRLVRQLTDAGFIQENIDWMQDYLDPAGKDDTGLLEQARRQDPMTLLPEQRWHCSNLLKGLITQENVDLRKRTAKAFYAVFGTDLSGEAIMQACPWNNLSNQLISLGSALDPAAALARRTCGNICSRPGRRRSKRPWSCAAAPRTRPGPCWPACGSTRRGPPPRVC